MDRISQDGEGGSDDESLGFSERHYRRGGCGCWYISPAKVWNV